MKKTIVEETRVTCPACAGGGRVYTNGHGTTFATTACHPCSGSGQVLTQTVTKHEEFDLDALADAVGERLIGAIRSNKNGVGTVIRALVAGLVLMAGLSVSACAVAIRPPVVTPPPPGPSGPTSFDFDYAWCTSAFVDNYCDGPPGVRFTLTPKGLADPPRIQGGDANGYVYIPAIPLTWVEATLTMEAPGYVTVTVDVNLPSLVAANNNGVHNHWPAVADHVDPSNIPLEQLAAIRGAMWTARLNLPYGPRPGQDSNILPMAFYGLYGPADQARMLHQYHDVQGYTHAVTGPVTGNDCYHSLYPCDQGVPSQAQWDAYLDTLQAWWDRGVMPVFFAKGDGWEDPGFAGAMDAMDALYAQPRAQKLIRIVIYPGWEPSGSKYGWPNRTYVAMVQRGARVFPHALRGLHTVADIDAPTGQDDDRTFPPGAGNRISWENVVPYIHFWAVQVGGYVDGSTPTPTAEFLAGFTAYWGDLHRRFTEGYRGWPTTSAWLNGGHLRVIYSEGASFKDFWQDWPESVALDLGDLAMKSGADGCLDGCRVAVPVR